MRTRYMRGLLEGVTRQRARHTRKSGQLRKTTVVEATPQEYREPNRVAVARPGG